MVGVLYGTMAAENRVELAKHISNKMSIHTKNKELPLQLSWSKIHGSSEKSPSVYATTICTKKEDYTEACEVLTKLYGPDTANKDWTRPLLRFIPLSMLKSTSESNDKFIRQQSSFDKNLLTLMPRNLQGLEEMITYKDTIHNNEFNITVGDILRNILDDTGNNMFDAVVPHGTKQYMTSHSV